MTTEIIKSEQYAEEISTEEIQVVSEENLHEKMYNPWKDNYEPQNRERTESGYSSGSFAPYAAPEGGAPYTPFEQYDSNSAIYSPSVQSSTLSVCSGTPLDLTTVTPNEIATPGSAHGSLQGQIHHVNDYSTPPSPYLHCPPSNPYGQYFFPPHFKPDQVMNYPHPPPRTPSSGEYNQNTASVPLQIPNGKRNFKLASLDKALSGLKKRRRASRSQCPCIKCCSARANCMPSPETHECIIVGCKKIYTRPAHLKAHLKIHEMDQYPQCQFCRRGIQQNADAMINHMFEHRKDMKCSMPP